MGLERRHSTGKVVRKLTSPMTIKGHKVAASKDNPEYLVETDEGKRAAHKPDALKKALTRFQCRKSLSAFAHVSGHLPIVPIRRRRRRSDKMVAHPETLVNL